MISALKQLLFTRVSRHQPTTLDSEIRSAVDRATSNPRRVVHFRLGEREVALLDEAEYRRLLIQAGCEDRPLPSDS